MEAHSKASSLLCQVPGMTSKEDATESSRSSAATPKMSAKDILDHHPKRKPRDASMGAPCRVLLSCVITKKITEISRTDPTKLLRASNAAQELEFLALSDCPC